MPKIQKVDVYEVEENGRTTYIIASTARGALEVFERAKAPEDTRPWWQRMFR